MRELAIANSNQLIAVKDMSDENNRETEQTLIEMPAPTAWPMIMALGLMLSFAGLVTSMAVTVVFRERGVAFCARSKSLKR